MLLLWPDERHLQGQNHLVPHHGSGGPLAGGPTSRAPKEWDSQECNPIGVIRPICNNGRELCEDVIRLSFKATTSTARLATALPSPVCLARSYEWCWRSLPMSCGPGHFIHAVCVVPRSWRASMPSRCAASLTGPSLGPVLPWLCLQDQAGDRGEQGGASKLPLTSSGGVRLCGAHAANPGPAHCPGA